MQAKPRVAVVGGGIAGSTAAMHLAEQGIDVTLVEQGEGLVNGPPICHLHAGGNLYREISEEQCIDLLKQSIDTVRLFPHAINVRPTIIATPLTDNGEPLALLPRLNTIQASYQSLVEQDAANAVLGEPDNYFALYNRAQLEALKDKSQPSSPSNFDDWLIPFARHADLDNLKYPVVVVQEYGLSVFRLAASVKLTLDAHENASLLLNTKLENAQYVDNKWLLNMQSEGSDQQLEVDYLVNATGYKTGFIDDLTEQPQQRLVEFKSAFVTHWDDCDMQWPEVIFHGERGTPQGMAQLTPYAEGYFQLHGMTETITLFSNGLVANKAPSSLPVLPTELESKIAVGWPEAVKQQRTQNAITHMTQHIPAFVSATLGGKPLYGAQQIPGDDPSLRAVDVSFTDNNYARIEVVKASSAYLASEKIFQQICEMWSQYPVGEQGLSIEQRHPQLAALSFDTIEEKAKQLANARGYPKALAIRTGNYPHRKAIT